ncbi:hypothetical protein [Qipengyuania spongiae]|uniref:DUF3784 domain-containing protein n=1 Tax=Qipengyuania spongiae TaxID=2909673 RepID=A0ABY5T4Y9_9SPHN|nr:hypothetical protein [Qipengyuania spongiae]UVI40009.1 hypothetical protein L1F33_03360 [Qipengyuania spongiae]
MALSPVMLIAILFVLGTLNIAANKAVVVSGHPMIEALPFTLRENGGRLAVMAEALLLFAAMLLAANGFPSAGWIYVIYSCGTLVAAWVILTGRA